MSARAFQIHPHDSVATLIDDTEAGAHIRVIGANRVPEELVASEKISRGHKVALVAHAAGAPILKFNVRIGQATAPIAPGAWVHLHNCASNHDQRSGTLDLQSGVPTDTDGAYA